MINSEIVELAAEINRIIRAKDELNMEVFKNEKNLKQSIANISHDFRTPLTSIIGYIQLLEKSKLDDNQKKYLHIICNKSYELKNLADDFFELSILEFKEMIPDLVKINVGNLLSNVILENINLIEEYKLNISINIDNAPIFIYADKYMLKRIFQNLISNAVKYSAGMISISLSRDENAIIKIKNSIDNNNIDTEKIFERFYKCDESRSKKGTGLGLSIVKLLTEKMNGDVNAKIINGYLEISVKFPILK